VLAVVVLPRFAARRQARRHVAAVVDELPDVVDLLRLTTSAGLPVTSAIRAIGGRPGGVIGATFVRASSRVAHGGTTADTLDVLHHDCGPAIRSLVDALADHDRYGTALGPVLDRLGLESRLNRRRQAEEAARRLPIALLFPLVLTVLPAFVLLTIIPLLAGSFSSLQP
jgi:tight adherence protein C